MSKPPNKLASFRSYSYYHVLAMCDSSETANALANSKDLSVWDHATRDTRVQDNRPLTTELGPYSPKKITDGGKYVILINGSTDASYVITRTKWTTATGANAVPDDRSTSIAVEGSMEISEPKGVAFLDQVVKCCVALGVDSAQVYYVLKTFFIGFRDDDAVRDSEGNRTDFISDIPPLTFIVYDVTGSFTEAGGVYQMEFVAAGHGASRLPQYSKAVNNMSVTAGKSLEETLLRLQDNINQSYEQYYNCVREQILSVQGDGQTIVDSLRKVKYVIAVGKDYKGEAGIKYTVTNQPQQYKNNAGCAEGAQITFPPHTSIETAISTIMSMSPQVQADMATGDTSTGNKYEYKVHTALVSEQAADEAEGVLNYTVYYRVERFLSPKSIAYEPAFNVLQGDQSQINNNPNLERIRQNIIEFDYMYTGKNIDILDFEMKVNMGMAYLQTATLANSFKSQLERAPNRTMQPSVQDTSNHMMRLGAIVQTPVFFGSQIRTPSLTNSQNPTDTIQSAYTLTKHSSVEVLDVTMRILGNTKLLGTTNQSTSPTYIVRSADRDTPQSETFPVASTTEANFNDWTFVPAYAKVNIKMPRENDDFALFTGQATSGDPRTDAGITDYARDFWFDGYYYVTSIEHTFDGGEFSQTLSMLGLPKRSAFESSKTNATRDESFKTAVGSCFDNQIGITSPTNTTGASETPSEAPPVVPHTPPSGNTEPTNKPDADTANRTASSPSNVKGWAKATPEVQAAILEAAQREGVDPVLMAQFAAKESNFRADASNPKSSAVGLYQFIRSTWNGLVDQGKVFGTTQRSTSATQAGSGSNWSKPSSADPRVNPRLNANAGAVFLKDNIRIIGSSDAGDLYLAHFLGPETARRVIVADNRSGGNELFAVAVGQTQAERIVRANSTIVKPNSTVGEIRSWAAKSMAKTLINPIPEAKRRQASTVPSGAPVGPSSNPQDAKRTADQPVAAVQNTRVQSSKTDTQPCAPSPGSTPQDRPTRGGQ